MLKLLTEVELLDRDRYGKIYLTNAGRTVAEELARTSQDLVRLLWEALDLPLEAADDCALMLLAKLREGDE